MKILCEKANGNKDKRIICTANNNSLCKFQRYCTVKHEWQNTTAFSTCERRLEDMAKRKNKVEFDESIHEVLPEETIDTQDNAFEKYEKAQDSDVDMINEKEQDNKVEEVVEVKEKKDEKDEKVEVVKTNKRTGTVLFYLGNETVVATSSGNITLKGRLGKKGRTIEFEV